LSQVVSDAANQATSPDSTANPVVAKWDAFTRQHRDAHTLQTLQWGQLKSQFGWWASSVWVENAAREITAGAQIIFRPLPFKIGTMAYIPAGALFASDDPAHPDNVELWKRIHAAARRKFAAFLKVEPCNWYRPRPDLPAQLEYAGLRLSPQTIQPPRTIVIDIASDEASILARMNQSTRYKARLKAKKEIDVREGTEADLASFNALMAVTGERDKFGVHSPAYYETAYKLFAPRGECALLIASYAGRDLAAIMVFRSGENAYYLYGASSNEERNRMPTYILQWEAIQWARRHGAIRYDLWGVPDADESELEARFEASQGGDPTGDGLWGVYGFKRGFGGEVRRSVGAWDYVYNRAIYAGYQWVLKRRKSSNSVI
jgi:peptidoglycan pentaglycine glycine transferase (the first glycine)